MAIQTAQEQLLLEIINRARLDPNAEAARLGIPLNEGLPAGTIKPTAKQPLAMNDDLIQAARLHSANMNARDFFAHDDPQTGTDPGDRTANAGYPSAFVGENIAFRGTTGAISLDTAMVNQLHADLFIDAGVAGRGHRTNYMLADWKEIGNGFNVGQFTQNGTTFNSVMLTEDFGSRQNRILTGVAYNDNRVNNDFYDIGEGDAGVRVNAGAATSAVGGYARDISAAAQVITFTGVPKVIKVGIGAGTDNVKLDVVDGNTIFSSANITSLVGAAGAKLLGIANLSINGGVLGETLTGNRGANIINGNAGNDILVGSVGKDTHTGGAGNDTFRYSAASQSTVGAAADIIKDFDDIGNDVIDLKAFPGTLVYRGTGAFTAAGQVHVKEIAGPDILVEVNTGGSLAPDLQIRLAATTIASMTATDFLLA